jgi:hypothetical protein
MWSISMRYVQRMTVTQVFLGTPHRGSKVANWGKLLASIAKVAFLSPKREFLETLSENSKELGDLAEDFVKIAAKYSFKSFYEENRLLGIKEVHSIHKGWDHNSDTNCDPDCQHRLGKDEHYPRRSHSN